MATIYNKEKHLLLTLQNVSKEKLKATALKQRRNVNGIINIAIEEYLEQLEMNEPIPDEKWDAMQDSHINSLEKEKRIKELNKETY